MSGLLGSAGICRELPGAAGVTHAWCAELAHKARAEPTQGGSQTISVKM